MKKKFKDISSSSKKLNRAQKKFGLFGLRFFMFRRRRGSGGGFKDISSDGRLINRVVFPFSSRGLYRFIFWLIKVFVCLFLLLVIVLSILATGLTLYVMMATDKQSTIKLDEDSVMDSGSTVVLGLDSNGKYVPISVVSPGPRRLYATIGTIPRYLTDAFVALEDKAFYKHKGVNFKRTFVAFFNMLFHFLRNNQGGSTITQQVVKNFTNDRASRGFDGVSRKFREIYRAFSLERTYTKDQIMEAYINKVPIGGIYGNFEGVKIAAKLYFNKDDMSKLTLAECASLASMIRNPVFYDPIKNPYNNKMRRDKTLRNMFHLGMISREEYEKAVKQPVKAVMGKISNKSISNRQSYFVDTVLNQAVSDYMQIKGIDDRKKADSEIKKSGVKIYTTVDNTLQAKLEELFENPSNFGLKSFKNKPKAACVIYDHAGNMKACVGGLGEKPAGDRAVMSYATSAIIMPGSSFKPFIYALAINGNMINYSSLVNDEPVKEVDGRSWPSNFDKKYHGNVTVEYAVANSLNTIPVELANKLGVERICDFLTDDLNFETIYPPSRPYDKKTFETEAMAIGSLTRGVKLSELTNAYQIFGNGGYFTNSTTYEKIANSVGEVLFEPKRSHSKVIDSSTSAIMNRLLRAVVVDGTGRPANLDSKGIEVVGKTGTSDDEKSLSFVGLTPKYVVGVWIGGKGLMKPAELFKLVGEKVLVGSRSDSGKETFDLLQEFVVKKHYCKESGQILCDGCGSGLVGYYKKGNLPHRCRLHSR